MLRTYLRLAHAGHNTIGKLDEGSPRKRARLRTSSPVPDQTLGKTLSQTLDQPAASAAATASARLNSAGSTGSTPGDGPGPAPGSSPSQGAASGAASPGTAAGDATPTSSVRLGSVGEGGMQPEPSEGASGCRLRGRASEAHAAGSHAALGGRVCAEARADRSQGGCAAGDNAPGSPEGSGRPPEPLGVGSGSGHDGACSVPGSPGVGGSACANRARMLDGTGGAGSSPRCMPQAPSESVAQLPMPAADLQGAGSTGLSARTASEEDGTQLCRQSIALLVAGSAGLCAPTTDEGGVALHLSAASAPAMLGDVRTPEVSARRPAGLEARSATRDQMLRELLRVTRGGEEG